MYNVFDILTIITDMSQSEAKFYIGQVICHIKFNYRGVVLDVDACFQGSEQWYEQVAKSRPPKDQPWYSILVENAAHTTYVAERHLQADFGQIQHPALSTWFDGYEAGAYLLRDKTNTLN